MGLGPSDQAALRKMNDFEVDRINIDYIANCKARIKTPEKAFSGACSIILTHRLEFLLSVFHPLGGTIMKIYADKDIIQIKNYSDKSFETYSNSDKVKLEFPIIKDISLTISITIWPT